MNILILAHDFPPLNTIGARRPFSWYNYFPGHGIRPVVITKSWEDASATIDEIARQKGLTETIIEEYEDRTLIKVPINRSLSEKLLNRYRHSRFSLLRKMFTFLNLFFSYPFSFFDRNVSMYYAAKHYLQHHRVDFIIATGEPFILFKHAHLLSKKFSVPWIADFRDGWIVNHVTAQRKGIAIRLLRSWEFIFEKTYIASCKFMVTVDPLLAEKLSALHHKTCHMIYNGMDEPLPDVRSQPVNGLPLILCHTGTMYPGHQTEVLLQAIHDLDVSGKISPAVLKVQFLGVEFYPQQTQRIMRYSPNAARYLQTTKRLPREEARRMNTEADFLIVFNDLLQPVIPAKTYEYLSSRRPILLILNDHSILGNLITELNAGLLLNSLHELEQFLLEKIEAKKSHKPVFKLQLNEEKALFYLRETQAARLVALLK